jgi:hypothetical protein
MKSVLIIAFSSLVFTSCNREDNKHISGTQDKTTVNDASTDQIKSSPAKLEIIHKNRGVALSDPISILGVFVTPEKNLILVLDEDEKERMKEVTSAVEARNSLLTVIVNGTFIDNQRNLNGWVSGIVISGKVSNDVIVDLREGGVKIAEIESVFFMYEDFVKAAKDN